MNNLTLDQFILNLPEHHILTPAQIKNVSQLIGLSKKFCSKSEVGYDKEGGISENSIILESGHQPNFLPYSGIWKKAFLLNRIQKKLSNDEFSSIAFFGLADQNISTARILSKNQIPALNKDGMIKIGFRIQDSDKFRSFNRIQKPSPEIWQAEIQRIEKHYSDLFKKTRSEIMGEKQSDRILEILWKSYELAGNFAEMNAFIFAKFCHEIFDIRIRFFLYSDMHREKVFLNEARVILQNLHLFNNSYNQAIEQKHLDIPIVKEDRIPFWFECECGVKIEIILIDSFTGLARCPSCNKEYLLEFLENFENLSTYFHNMDFNAVSRNMIMADGLGDSLFLSGSGGSLQYGHISDRISENLGFHLPVTFAWRSQDFYLGMVHNGAIHDLRKQFFLSPDDFLSGTLKGKILGSLSKIQAKITDAEVAGDKKEVKYWSGMLNNSKNQISMIKNIFATTPSFLDLLENLSGEEIIHAWNLTLDHAEIGYMNRVCQVSGKINYHTHLLSDLPSDDMSVIYENIKNIEVG